MINWYDVWGYDLFSYQERVESFRDGFDSAIDQCKLMRKTRLKLPENEHGEKADNTIHNTLLYAKRN